MNPGSIQDYRSTLGAGSAGPTRPGKKWMAQGCPEVRGLGVELGAFQISGGGGSSNQFCGLGRGPSKEETRKMESIIVWRNQRWLK